MEMAGKHVCPQTLSLTGRFGEPQSTPGNITCVDEATKARNTQASVKDICNVS